MGKKPRNDAWGGGKFGRGQNRGNPDRSQTG